MENNNPTPGTDGITTDSVIQAFSEASRTELSNRGLNNETAIIDALKAGDQFKGVDLSKMVAVPAEGAKPEDIMAVYDKLGRPAKPEDYGVSVPEGEDPAFINEMLPVLHKAGLTKYQATALVNGWNERVANANKVAGEKYAKEMAELKTQWGANYDNNIAEAKRAAAELGIPKENLARLESNVTGSKGLWEMFYNIAKRTADGQIKGGGSTNPTINLQNPAEASKKLKELMSDKSFADKIVKGDQEAVKLFNQLQAARFGDRNND